MLAAIEFITAVPVPATAALLVPVAEVSSVFGAVVVSIFFFIMLTGTIVK